MKYCKRVFSLVLAWMLLLGLAPAGLLEALPAVNAFAADTMTIQNVNDWNTFVRDGKDYAGGTVTLAADIELSGDILIKDNFRGTFNGNGHTIQIAGGSQLVSPTDTNGESIVNVGLFGMLDGATVENLNIRLNGTLDGSKVRYLVLAEGDNTYRYAMYFGVLAGAAKNGTTIRRVALTNGSTGGLNATPSGTFRVALNHFLTNDANIGGLVGTMNDSTVEECFTGIDILTYRWTPDRKQAVLRTGALVGFASNCTIRNCYNANANVTSYHSNPEQSDHTASQVGGIAAALTNGSTVTNCIVEVATIATEDITDSLLTTSSTVDGHIPINGNYSGRAGYIYALKDENCTLSQCYAYNGARIGRTGYTVVDNVTTGANAESSAKQALLGDQSIWVESTSAKLGLAWMFQTPSVTLTPTDDGADVTIAVSQLEPVTPRPAATSWSYTVQGALMGRKATPAAPEIQTNASSQVSSVKILESRTGDASGEPASYEHYSGGVYQLYAEVTGTNLPQDTAVTWSLEGVTDEQATVDQNGLLTVKQPYFGTFTVKAETGGKSASCKIDVRPAQLSISPAAADVAKGGSVDFGAVITGYFSQDSSPYKVLWALSGDHAAGTSIDENGTLTVAADETADTLTVTATFEIIDATEEEEKLVPVATATVTVKDAPQPVEKTVTPSASGQDLGTVTLALGQTLELSLASITVTPPQGYTEEDGKTQSIDYTLAPADTDVLTDNGDQSYTAVKAGTVTITGELKRLFEKEDASAENGKQQNTVVWKSTLKVTVSPIAAVENSTAAMAEVKGSKNTPELKNSTVQDYTLAFAASDGDVRWYQLTTTSTPPASSGWVSVPEEGLNYALTKQDQNAVNGNGLYLWMYREGDQETTEDSPVVGYLLKAGTDGAAKFTELDSAPSKAELPYKAQFSVSGTWRVENGQVEGSPFSAVELLRGLEKEYTTLAACEVRVTVRQLSGTYSNRNTTFVSEAVQSVAVGNTALKPSIQPNAEGQLPNNKFTITVPDQPNVEVYYQIYPNRSADQISSAEYPSKETGILYNPTQQKEIAYPAGVYERVTVIAITYPQSGSAMKASEPEIVTYTPANLNAPDAPQLVIGENEADFVGGDLYDNGQIFKFRYTANSSGGEAYQVYYTVNGHVPDPSTATLYDPENPPTMDFGMDSKIEINAIVYDPNYGISSSVATFTVQMRSSAERPVANVASGSTVRPSQPLILELDESFVERMISVTSFLSAQYAEYSEQSDVFGQYADYQRASNSDEPIEGMRYLIVDSGSSFSTSELPTIRYLKNDSESALDNASTYQYAVCQIWSEVTQTQNEETGQIEEEITHYIRFRNPGEILLDGASGDKITIRAKLYPPTGVTSYLASEEATFTYTVRGSVAAPQAVPSTDMQGSTAVDIGDRIALSGDVNTEIFYTVDGSRPVVTWQEDADGGHWVSGNESTLLYDSTQGIRVPNEDAPLFVLNVIAVSADDSLEASELTQFVYTVNPLPQAASPTASPTTDPSNPTRLANGERIMLTTSTLNTDIYYTTDGSVPDYAQRDAWNAAYAAAAEKGQDSDGTLWYEDEEGNQYREPATRIYDVQQGIAMAATEAQPVFSVTAIALDKDRQTPATSISNAVSFVYRLAQTDAPVASPQTSADAVSTIEPNTRITLTSSTAGAKIYYTKDTTLPDVSDLARVEQEYAQWLEGWNGATDKERGTDSKGVRWYKDADGATHTEPSTIPYDAAEGITMPETVTTFFTLRAVAVVSDGSRAASESVTFSYQLPAPVQAVYASPVDGTAVEYGTSVTLHCGTEGAQIFYKIHTSQPGENDAPVVNQDLSYTEPITITKEVWIQAVAVRQGVKSVVATYHYTVAPTAAAPVISLPSGSVVTKGTRVALSGEGTIVFTTDGSDPKAADAPKQYGTVVNLDGDYGSTVTVRAYIQRDGYTPSDTVSFSYTICPEEDYLAISVAGGSVVANNTSVTLSTGITNGQIFYTLDGSTPQVKNVYTASADKNYTTYEWTAANDATKAGSSFSLSGNPDTAVTVRAIVVVNGGEGGQVATFTYKFQPQAASPTANIPTGAVVFDGATVTLTAKEGTIYYTTDGTTPTTSSHIYSQPIDVSGSSSTVLKAIAVVENKAASEVAVFRYTRAGQTAIPVFSIASGEIDTGTTVSITSSTENAVIYYSTDGTEPTADNLKELTMYVAPVSITRAVTIKAIAVSDRLDPSSVQTATYTVKKPAPQEPEEEASSTPQITVTDRLTSRRTYNSTQDGPSYSDVVLRESAYNTVLSAQEGTVPGDALLTVKQIQPEKSDETSVKSSLGQEIARLYEAQLTLNGDSVTPAGEVELGFAIPPEYQNGVVSVSRINDDGTLTQFTARRSGGIAYIKTDALGRFALSVPASGESASSIRTIALWGGGAAALALAVLLFLLLRRRKKAEEEEQEIQSLEEFQEFQ